MIWFKLPVLSGLFHSYATWQHSLAIELLKWTRSLEYHGHLDEDDWQLNGSVGPIPGMQRVSSTTHAEDQMELVPAETTCVGDYGTFPVILIWY
jgi:hypothetical protein